MATPLEYAAWEFLRVAQRAKEVEQQKKDARGALVAEITKAASEQIEMSTVNVSRVAVDRHGGLEAWLLYNHPDKEIYSYDEYDDEFVVHLAENPSMKRYSFEYEGYKFSRTLRYDGSEFDAKAFIAWVKSNEELSDEQFKALEECFTTRLEYDVDQEALLGVVSVWPELLTAVEQFSYVGKPVAVLSSPAPVKEEDAG